MRTSALLPFILLVCACANGTGTTATLSATQCSADWYSVGVADRQDGAPSTKIRKYETACARGGNALTARQINEWSEGWSSDGPEVVADVADTKAGPGNSNAADSPIQTSRRPSVRPNLGLGVGIGSRGVTVGSRVGIGIAFPLY